MCRLHEVSTTLTLLNNTSERLQESERNVLSAYDTSAHETLVRRAGRYSVLLALPLQLADITQLIPADGYDKRLAVTSPEQDTFRTTGSI